MALRRVNPVVLQGEVKTSAEVNKTPRADGTGKISVSWLPYVRFTVSDSEPSSPLPMDWWRDTSVNQIKMYDGKTWRTVA